MVDPERASQIGITDLYRRIEWVGKQHRQSFSFPMWRYPNLLLFKALSSLNLNIFWLFTGYLNEYLLMVIRDGTLQAAEFYSKERLKRPIQLK